jgi:hypothetical protein
MPQDYKASNLVGRGDIDPDVLRFQYVDILFDPAYTDVLSEITEDQRNIIAIFRAYHVKMGQPILDDNGKPIPLYDEKDKPVKDYDGNPSFRFRGGLPGVMQLCDNFLKLNVSYGRQGRKEAVRILEPKASNVSPNWVTPGGLPPMQGEKRGVLGFLKR